MELFLPLTEKTKNAFKYLIMKNYKTNKIYCKHILTLNLDFLSYRNKGNNRVLISNQILYQILNFHNF